VRDFPVLLISLMEPLFGRQLLVKTSEGFVETVRWFVRYHSSVQGSCSATVSFQAFLQFHGFIVSIPAVPQFNLKHPCSATVSFQASLQCHSSISSIPVVLRCRCKHSCSATIPLQAFLQCHGAVARIPAVPQFIGKFPAVPLSRKLRLRC
jgi:hypothetical protein